MYLISPDGCKLSKEMLGKCANLDMCRFANENVYKYDHWSSISVCTFAYMQIGTLGEAQ
jgi:hypothetical protein